MHKACDYHRKPVDASICDACPLRVFIEKKEPKKFSALPIADHGNEYRPCEFRHRHPQGLRCGVTNLPVTPETCTRCVKEEKEALATWRDKVRNYSAALRRWIAAGSPSRTDEEAQQLFDDHCSKCSMFDKERQVCNSCGCPANKDQPAIKNKLKMATEGCPLGQFPPKVETHA
jgi:ribosomal protein L37E